jgi:hypothetical protein
MTGRSEPRCKTYLAVSPAWEGKIMGEKKNLFRNPGSKETRLCYSKVPLPLAYLYFLACHMYTFLHFPTITHFTLVSENTISCKLFP